MPTFDRPDSLPLWCENNPQSTAQPPVTLREAGYVANEPPVAEHWNYWLNLLGHWVAYLDQSDGANVTATALNFNLRLLGGGSWSFSAATKVLAWSEAVQLAVPGLAASENTLAAGNVALAQGQVLWANANIPYTTKGDLTSGSAQINNALATDAVSIGQLASGDGLPAGTTVTAVNDDQITLSAAATKTQAGTSIAFHANGPLSARVTDMASFTPGPNAVVFAIAGENEVTVGANSGQMLLRDGENKRLLGTGFVSVHRGVAGQAISALQPCYLSVGASDGGRTAQNLYPCDAGSAGQRRAQFLGFAPSAASAGATVMLVTSGVLNGFSGLTPGAVYYLDPANVGGITATAPTAAGTYAVAVGLALSNTQLRVSASGGLALAPLSNDLTLSGTVSGGAFVNAAGFKSQLDCGQIYTQQGQANSEYFFQQTFLRDGTPSSATKRVPMGAQGSILGWAYINFNAQPLTVNIYKNDQKIYATALTSPVTTFQLRFPKGTLPFNAGDYLSMSLLTANNAAISASIHLLVELTGA